MTVQDSFPPVWQSFRGYTIEDVEFLRKLAATEMAPEPGCLIDYFGMKTYPESEPIPPEYLGRVVDTPPFPSDGLYAEGIEYAAIALSLQGNYYGYEIMELGAGFGPWVTLGAICAQRLGRTPVMITAVEADPERFAHLRRHLAVNGLIPADAPDTGHRNKVYWRLERAIAWTEDGTAYWQEGGSGDSGRQASASGAEVDYRGLAGRSSAVKAISLTSLLEGRIVDLLHVDIQGSEVEVIASATEALCRRVRRMFVGTHSRLIEGQLIELLSRLGWLLEREVPCIVKVDPERPSVLAMTERDGGQVWRNPRLT